MQVQQAIKVMQQYQDLADEMIEERKVKIINLEKNLEKPYVKNKE